MSTFSLESPIIQELPHERCNFITEDKQILIGAIPIPSTIDKLLNFGITLFVDLQENTKYLLPKHIKYLHYPIAGGNAPTLVDMNKMFNQIIHEYKNNGKIYIHCNGGHGRAGTVGAFIIGKLYNYDCFEAISYIEKCRNTRIDLTRNFIPTPESNTQVNFLFQELGLKNINTLPDRSNTLWFNKVIEDRKSHAFS